MRFLFVSQFEPVPEGHGGNHRAYQIYCDLSSILGYTQVAKLTWQSWLNQNHCPSGAKSSEAIRKRTGIAERFYSRLRLKQRLKRAIHTKSEQNVLSNLLRNARVSHLYSNRSFIEHYTNVLRDIRPKIVFFEHAGFNELVSINRAHNIDSVACIQNLESFDSVAPLDRRNQDLVAKMGIEFCAELEFLRACEKRFFISKVEASIAIGLGLESAYYPYVPAGKLRTHLFGIRNLRRSNRPKQGLFLLMGSAYHDSTRISFEWFLRAIADDPLPEPTKIVVAGGGTDKVFSSLKMPPNVEIKGWLSNEELAEMMVQVVAVLVPQKLGFGALTRLPELSCAGIPTLASEHPCIAIDVPPGIFKVKDVWPAWRESITNMTTGVLSNSVDQYISWESEQDSSFTNYLTSVV